MIERRHGREHPFRNTSRTLDLDRPLQGSETVTDQTIARLDDWSSPRHASHATPVAMPKKPAASHSPLRAPCAVANQPPASARPRLPQAAQRIDAGQRSRRRECLAQRAVVDGVGHLTRIADELLCDQQRDGNESGAGRQRCEEVAERRQRQSPGESATATDAPAQSRRQRSAECRADAANGEHKAEDRGRQAEVACP
ncbi:MAG: hypothetical protein IPL57_06885 [Rubrivivax sp.]|nr:hypothetical protein [Rubrivivax sp.]